MKTHLAQNGFSRAADLLDYKRKCQPHFVCGQAPAVQRQPGIVMVVAAGPGRPTDKTAHYLKRIWWLDSVCSGHMLALLAVHSIETISTSILSSKEGHHCQWVA